MSQKVQYNGRLFDRRHLAAAQMAKDMLSMSDPIMRRCSWAIGILSLMCWSRHRKNHADALQAALHFVTNHAA